MRASLDYVKRKFDEFNRLCFGGVLPPLPLRLSNARRALGMFVYPTRYPDSSPRGTGECHLRISTRLDLPENDVEDVIIHEMIHYYIWYMRIPDTGPHGKAFHAMMDRINRLHGRNLTVRHRTAEEEQATDTHSRDHYICVTSWRDGTRAVTSCARTRIFEINRVFRAETRVRSLEWYWTRDPWWNRYPNSITAKCYRISPSDLEEHLRDATPCECTDTVFRPLPAR